MSVANTFSTMNSNYKDDYSDQKKKPRFKRLRSIMGSKAEKEASKDPKKFLKENKEPSIKGTKGVAF